MPEIPSPGRASPPTQRVISVLDYLTRHPHQRFGVSELARRLELAKPTCLGIVMELAEAGYLIRDLQDKTYRLGPALIRLGQVAQESIRVDPAAREALFKLSAKLGTTAALSAVLDHRITLLDIAVPPGANTGVHVGQSYPFAPPVGLMFVLWDDHALQSWLEMEPTIPVRTDTERLDRVIADCRASGYLAERLTPAGRRLYALMAGMSSSLHGELRALLGELVSDIGERVYLRGEILGSGRQRHDVSVISAPIYDHHGHQVMVLSLHIGRGLTDSEINRQAKSLLATADTITGQLGGLKPSW